MRRLSSSALLWTLCCAQIGCGAADISLFKMGPEHAGLLVLEKDGISTVTAFVGTFQVAVGEGDEVLIVELPEPLPRYGLSPGQVVGTIEPNSIVRMSTIEGDAVVEVDASHPLYPQVLIPEADPERCHELIGCGDFPLTDDL